MDKKSQHVMTNPKGGWAVRQSGAARASRVFPTQTAAEQFAKTAARKEGSEVFVHRGDGTVRNMYSYRNSAIADKI